MRIGFAVGLGLLACAAVILPVPVAGAVASDRAYEMVSPPGKNGFDVTPFIGAVRASVDGDAIAFQSGSFIDPQADSAVFIGSNQYLAKRGNDGWATASISPPTEPNSPVYPDLNQSGVFGFWTPDLSAVLLGTGPPELNPSAPEGYFNLYVRQSDTGIYELATPATPPAPAFSVSSIPNPYGASQDLKHVVFRSGVPLLPGDPSGGGLYEYVNGMLRLVSVLPSGTASTVRGSQSFDHKVSRDGSRIIFETTGTSPDVYLRENGLSTVHVSASQRTVPEENERKDFRYATPDVSHILFTSEEPLTDDSVASDGSQKLYRFDVEREELVDLSITNETDGARTLGVAGMSSSGDDVYFVARGGFDDIGTPGEPNLYHWQSDGTSTGSLSLIGTLNDSDGEVWAVSSQNRATRLDGDGTRLAFTSTEQLTSYDNQGRRQIYIYYADLGELACASCNPAGRPPKGEAQIRPFQPGLRFDEDFKPRNFSVSGDRFFFDTSDGLLPEDGNGKTDVYVFSDPDGDGDGTIGLVTTGRSSDDSYFMDASASGDDVFFVTREQLVGIDRDDNLDLYSARVGGGIAAQNPPQPAPPCIGESCRGKVPGLPQVSIPGSELFVGPDDPWIDDGRTNTCGQLARRQVVAQRKSIRLRRQARQLVSRAAQRSGPRSRLLMRAARNRIKAAKRGERAARISERQRRKRNCGPIGKRGQR